MRGFARPSRGASIATPVSVRRAQVSPDPDVSNRIRYAQNRHQAPVRRELFDGLVKPRGGRLAPPRAAS